MSRPRRTRGSLSVEVVALVPMMMVLVLLTVFGFRWTHAASDAVHAAGIAAREASASLRSTAIANGRSAGTSVIAASRWCRGATVRVTRTESGGDIWYSARVTCTVDATGLSLLRMGRATVVGSSVQVVDRFRSDR